jgi:hypothetical protein
MLVLQNICGGGFTFDDAPWRAYPDQDRGLSHEIPASLRREIDEARAVKSFGVVYVDGDGRRWFLVGQAAVVIAGVLVEVSSFASGPLAVWERARTSMPR